MTDYEDYLVNLHSQSSTPEKIISDTIQEVTKKEVVGKTRIIAGESNEVYEIELSDDSHLIIRITIEEDRDFEQEQWAINKCQMLNLPVPNILLIKHLTTENKALHICVQSKLEGEPMERGSFDFRSMPKDRVRKIIYQAGEVLSKIHSVPTDGFGYLDKNGRGPHKTLADLMSEHIPNEE